MIFFFLLFNIFLMKIFSGFSFLFLWEKNASHSFPSVVAFYGVCEKEKVLSLGVNVSSIETFNETWGIFTTPSWHFKQIKSREKSDIALNLLFNEKSE